MGRRFQKTERTVLEMCLALAGLVFVGFVLEKWLDLTLLKYLLVLGLAGVIVLARERLGKYKNRNRLRSSTTATVVAIMLAYGILSYASGLIIGFNHSAFSLELSNILSGFLPVLLLALLVENLRAIVSRQYIEHRYILGLFTLMTILLYLLLELPSVNFDNPELVFLFLCMVVFSTIARETLCAFLCFRHGTKSALVFKLGIMLYPYMIPIVPAFGNYLYSFLHVLLPFIIYLATLRTDRFSEEEAGVRLKRINFKIITIPLTVCGIILTALVSGFFPYQLIAVASDSMLPVYGRGDAVLVKKLDAEDVRKDDILVFKKDRVIITHRVVEIEEHGDAFSFTTKGDNNDSADGFQATDEDVVGKVVSVSKYIGFPTVWINEIFNKG
ncbi:signal peptidase I [Candidatus Saccharibacteria bacterium]|nr:signal peptidase I [Candidatus Saccharibacteria bacterium]